MSEQLPLWLITASLILNALFLRRLLTKLDRLYDCVVGTVTRRGLLDRVRQIERVAGIVDVSGDVPVMKERRRDRRP